MAGRRKLLTPEVADALCEAARELHPDSVCAGLVGISEATLYRWLAQGRADDEEGKDTPEREFCETYTRAKSLARVKALDTLKSGMASDPKWAAWYLERCGAFAPPKLEVSGGLTLTHDTARQLLAEAARDLPDDDVGVDDDPIRAARET